MMVLCTVCCVLCTVCCVLCIVYCVLCTVCCWLRTVCFLIGSLFYKLLFLSGPIWTLLGRMNSKIQNT